MNRSLAIQVFMFLVLTAGAQTIDPRIAPAITPLSEVELFLLPALDNSALLEAELERRGPGIAPRFAESIPVEVTPATHGTWEILSDTEALWRLRLLSPGAYSLNLGFQVYQMPEDGSMILYTSDRKRVIGPFTPADNEEHAQLWTPIVEGEALIIEVRLPRAKKNQLGLLLSRVNHDFLGFSQLLSSGECNLDVNCGAKNGWPIIDLYRDIIPSVAIFGFNGDTFCSGVLVNNTANDCTPYFLTANHCGVNKGNAPSVLVYWNFEQNSCRPVNSPLNSGTGNGRLNDFNSGAILRANFSGTDFALLELDDPVSASAEAYYAGWSAEDTPPIDTLICIHHPNSNEKRISFSFSDAYRGKWGRDTESVPDGDHLVVPQWDIGTTEVGSSGAPLFNATGQVVGQLHGGLAGCNNQEFDQFGWFHSSWEGGGTLKSSLRPWLDPENTGIITIQGKKAGECGFYITATEKELNVCSPDSAVYTFRVSNTFRNPVQFSFQGLPPNTTGKFSVNPVAPGRQTELRITNIQEAPEGLFDLQVEGTDGSITVSQHITLFLTMAPPPQPQLTAPANGEAEVSTFTALTWQEGLAGSLYEIQIALDEQFQELLLAQGQLTAALFQPAPLASNGTFYWRVRSSNACGNGPWSEVFSFSTANISCDTWSALDVPTDIPTSGTPQIKSTIRVDKPGTVVALEIPKLDIDHSFTGDLRATLIAPNSSKVILFDRPGYPTGFFGCDGDNLRLSFRDNALASAQQLEDFCEEDPAITGDFQPADQLGSMRGLDATGDWVLEIKDHNNQDGGTLLRWSLNLCVAEPKDLSLKSQAQEYVACRNQPLMFDLSIGTGFNKNGVELQAEGLPEGARIDFSKNPAAPGSFVTVTLDSLTDPGNFKLAITATDHSASSSTSLTIVVPDTPAPARILSPTNESNKLDINPLLIWNQVAGVHDYQVIIADNPILLNPVINEIISDTLYLLSDLNYEQTYYWQIRAHNQCGEEMPSDIYRFTTGADLSFFLSTNTLETCNNQEPGFKLQVGQGFEGAALRYEISPAFTFRIAFDTDTLNLSAGEIINATIKDLTGLFNTYLITIHIFNEQDTVTKTLDLSVTPAPEMAQLEVPVNEEMLGTTMPQFKWSVADHAADYLLEISHKEHFDDLELKIGVMDTTLSLLEELDPGRYFWRITARNACGFATTATRTFRIGTNSAGPVPGVQINIFPNPAHSFLYIDIDGPLSESPDLQLFAVDGRLLRSVQLPAYEGTIPIDISTFPAGVYLLHFSWAGNAIIRRVVIE